MKYYCKVCNSVFILKDAQFCPFCLSSKDFIDEVDKEILEHKNLLNNAVNIDLDNPGIVRDVTKCIDCGICKETCENMCGLSFGNDTSLCLSCGQCIMTCPTNALQPRNAYLKVKKLLESKVGICFTSPATRVSIGESFGYEVGSFMQSKLVSLLRKLGFKYVFDTTFGADLTVMEEATELVNHLKNGSNKPMFSSCCPAWVKYAHNEYSFLNSFISTCKSPIAMQSAIIEKYFLPKMNLVKENVICVAITPCTAKKMEIKLDGIYGCDEVITVSELISWTKLANIDFKSLPDSDYDNLFGEGSGSGVIFGASGGVCQATLRTSYYLMTNKQLDKIDFYDVKGLKNVKEASIIMGDIQVNALVVHKIKELKKVLDLLKEKTYHFIEVMNCEGGCVGGGGEPKTDSLEIKEKRALALYKHDKEAKIRFSYQNPDIIKIYQDYLQYPGSDIAKEILHLCQDNVKN